MSGRIISSVFGTSRTVGSISYKTYGPNPLAARFLSAGFSFEASSVFSFLAFLYAGVSQRPRFFRFGGLCRHACPPGEFGIFEIQGLQAHDCWIAGDIDDHVAGFSDHSLSVLARAFHAHSFIGREQGTRDLMR